jgi:membrane fusion protein, multidrug efflux system
MTGQHVRRRADCTRLFATNLAQENQKARPAMMPTQDDWGAGAHTESETRQVDPMCDRRTGRFGPTPGDEPGWEHTPARDEPPVRERPSPELRSEAEKGTRAPGHDTENEPRKPWYRRHPIAVALGLLCLLLALPAGYLYWDYTSHFEATDDAYIASRQFAIAPEVSGYITSVPVTDNEHVDAGAVIARIDDRTYRAALAQAKAQVAAAQANIENSDAQIAVQQAQISAD